MLDSTTLIHLSLPEIRKNLEDGLYHDTWTSAGTRERKRAALNKAERIFRHIGGYASTDEMPTTRDEVEYFFDTYMDTGTFHPKARLKSKAQAKKWYEEYCTICDVASGLRATMEFLSTLDDDWKQLLDHLKGDKPGSEIANPYQMIRVRALARECRFRGIPAGVLSAQVLEGFVGDLKPATQNALFDAIVFLAQARSDPRADPTLFPHVSPSEVHFKKETLRRVTPEMHPDFKRLVEDYIDVKRRGIATLSFGTVQRQTEVNPASEDHIRNIKSALRWLWHGLIVLGRADMITGFDREVLADPALIHDVCNACETGAMGKPITTQFRRERMHAALGFLEWLSPGLGSQIPAKFFESRSIARIEETDFKRFKRTSCLNFIADEAKQRTFFQLPLHFYNEAKPLIDRFQDLGHPDNGQLSRTQNRALELAILAALTAIMTRFPLRLKTVARLKSGGADPYVLFPDSPSFSRHVVLDVPGYIQKNGRFAAGVPLAPTDTVCPRDILRWYIDEAQPLVTRCKHKHEHLRRPDLLTGGLSPQTLRRYWLSHVPDTGLDLKAHMCRHYVASLLLSKGVTVEDVAELLCISPSTTSKSYAFVERVTIIQGVMTAQNEIFSKLEV
jgi:hypothetical protein